MKKTMTITAAVVLAAAAVAFATTVNPTSNVLGDTAHTANALALRDGSGNLSIITAEIGAQAVLTAALYLDQPSSRVACITTAKTIGNCTNINATNGVCNACN